MNTTRLSALVRVLAMTLVILAAPAVPSWAAPDAGPLGERVRATETEAEEGAGTDEAEPMADPIPTPTIAAPQSSPLEPEVRPSASELPVAPDVKLSEPVDEFESVFDAAPAVEPQVISPPLIEPPPQRGPLVLLGEEIAPGTSARLSWSPAQNFDGLAVPTPVLVVNGAQPGLTLCLTAAVHGDELNGIEIVRRVMYDLDPQKLNGTVIGVPIVNLHGFRRSSRYLPDRRDLNRYFPGNPSGSSASRIAHSFFNQVIRFCDALVDVHTGSFLRSNLPQLRADMTQPDVAALTQGFGATAVLHNTGTRGTLRRAATDFGIPAVTLETGEPSRLQDREIEHGTKGIQSLLNKLGMARRTRIWGDPEPVYYKSTWVRASRGGLLFGEVKLGQRVREDALLGTITDPITNVRSELRAPVSGRILGMALNQVVLPGFAAYRIGIPSTGSEMVEQTDAPPNAGTLDNGDDAPAGQPDEGEPGLDDIETDDENSE